MINNCHLNETEFFHSYLLANRYHVVSVIPYNIVEYPIYTWVDFLITFSWNFVDVFVILISVALDFRFKQINHRILKTKKSTYSFDDNEGHVWTEIRLHYYSMIELVEDVDDQISSLILLGTGNNLFTVCVITFRILTR